MTIGKAGMKRIVLRVLVFLLIGAAINVAVAWGCAIRGQERWVRYTSAEPWPVAAPDDWPDRSGTADIMFSRTWRHIFAVNRPHADGLPFFLQDVELSGWPLPSMRSSICASGSSSRMGMNARLDFAAISGLEMPAWLLRSPGSRNRSALSVMRTGLRPSTQYLPIMPVWPGIAANAALYALAAWAALAVARLLRALSRVRRGLCLRCAYPVGISSVCTECGRPVKARMGVPV